MSNSDKPSKPSSFKLTKLSEIRENPNNPRIIKDDKFQKLVKSIKEFPEMLEARPIVVNPENIVLGGNMRLKACKAAGLKEAPVYVASWEESKANEFIVKDNVGFGEWDWDMLANEWDAVELEEWGLDVWTPEEEPTEGLTDPDEVPEAPEEPKTKPGDLYILGEHRLLCGDSTKAEDVEKLMNGERASFAIADPPYNVGYSYATYDDNKSDEEYNAFCNAYTDNALTYAPAMAITPGKSNEKYYKDREDFCEYLIWFKGFGLSRGSWYKAMVTEPILLHGTKPKNKFYSTDHIEQGTDREKGLGDKHTCPKPVELWRKIIEPMTENGDVVLEMFGGSGTTAIVCEKTGRKARLIEIDPKYCDVIIKRWEDFTGKKAELWKP
jgi:site-specific DNA-methyltransferase (adenine-specific)